MHPIHTTPGFIIDSRPYGEAGKLISIFTRDFGLVTASASGIRFERSKLRYHSQDYSFGSFSLVCGKELWRLTNASEGTGGHETIESQANPPVIPASRSEAKAQAGIQSQPTNIGNSGTLDPRFRGDDIKCEEALLPEAKALIARLALLLRRLLHGEEANPSLFECVESAVHFIHVNGGGDALNEERLKTLESLTVIRIMHRLGYIGDAADLNGHVASLELNIVLLDELKGKRLSMNSHINRALKESHL